MDLFLYLVIIIGIITFSICIGLFARAIAQKNNICPLCNKKVGMNSIVTRDKRVVCLNCCRKAGVQLHNTKCSHSLSEIQNILENNNRFN